MIRVLSVDDHPLLRDGIAALVNAECDMKLVAEACNGQEAIEKFRLHRPDVTLMDLQMPALNGIEAIIGIRSEFPIATGNANKEIACQLSIAEDTVKSHVTNLLAKLGANDRTHAVTIGLKRGIIEL
jgi:DNA-binding NarL/FixJ family response regulator